jgi:hypothetical protein
VWCAAFFEGIFMNEAYDSIAQQQPATGSSATSKAVDIVNRTKESVLAGAKEKPAVFLSGAFVATIILSLLIGYWRGRVEEASRRQRIFEQLIPELTKWMKQHGSRLYEPIREGIETTKSAAEEVSRSGANLQRYLRPMIRKQKRKFANFF